MKLLNLSSLLIVLILLTLSGCAIKPKPKKEVTVDATLPKISLTKNATKSSMLSIALEWKLIKDERVDGIYIYRDSLDENLSKNDSYYDTINNRFSTHYLDTNVKPNHRYNYYFVTYSKDAQSNMSEKYQAQAKPVLDSVSWIYAANGLPRSAKVIWRPHKNGVVEGYEIHRKTLDSQKWQKVGKVNGRLNAEYIDNELRDSMTYQYNIRAVTFDGIVSKPSKVVKSITKKLPLIITNLEASNDLPKKISLTWDKSANDDFVYYKLYKSAKPDSGYSFVTKLTKNSYMDEVKKDGEQFFYLVTAVDIDGLESKKQPHSTQGISLSKPLAPAMVEANLVGKKILIKWRKNDFRTQSYKVIRRYNESYFNTIVDEFIDIKEKSFEDTKIKPDTTYRYSVKSVDKHGIESKPTMEVVVEYKAKIVKKEEKK
jgi:fibronectin type 3 domain-containing protein